METRFGVLASSLPSWIRKKQKQNTKKIGDQNKHDQNISLLLSGSPHAFCAVQCRPDYGK